MKSIIIFIDYFGRWPSWFEMFLESCRKNATISWCIHTDCEIPPNAPPNVQFIRESFDVYCKDISDKLGVLFRPETPYNICNLKPMIGYLYKNLHSGFDYYGWGDLDVIYGDIRSIYTPGVLTHTVISTHRHICSGHLTLFKNDSWLHEAFLSLEGWKARLANPVRFQWHESLTEVGLTALFCPVARTRRSFAARIPVRLPIALYYQNNYFREQWSTPFTPKPWIRGQDSHPEIWYWRNGVITNNLDGRRQFLYLHLMNFKRKCWVNEELYGHSPTWERLPNCMRFGIEELWKRDEQERNVRIDRNGIHLEHVSDIPTEQ